ncbi:TonB-dependent receptor [Parvularcula sp. ZS-1/3]|uniref:TonB-dependent receptor n=1 Tax=Parvularcula mediterranea TaxID=2732508 RepID=A0A7Y3W4U6_9PROT|nr:TonB-dependent receptor [Parvularcula mediterranea]NNU15848.1 TonB-dependent receptor [Parvularcula mediterranea]
MKRNLLRASCAILPLAIASAHANTGAAHDPDEDTIVVTATPLDKTAGELLAPVSVLDGDELRRQARESLGETLRREPGVSTTFFGPGASRPIIRGLGGDRVRTLTNGIGTIDAAAASPDHATPIEPALAETIEVVRGTGLLRYGSSAAGGVVNVLDGRIPQEVPEGGVDAAVSAGYSTVDEGTFVSGAVQAAIAKLGNHDLVISLQGSRRDADDYEIPGFAESEAFMEAEEEEEHDEGDEHGDEHGDEEAEGILENSFLETSTYAAGLSLVGDRSFLGFSVQQVSSEYGIPAGHGHGHGEEEEEHGDEHGEEEEGGVTLDLEQTRYDINGRLEFGGFIQAANLFAGYADYEHTEFEPDGEAGTVFSNEGYEIRIEAVQATIGGWSGASGIQLRSRDFSAVGEEAFVPETETEQFGIFTFQEVENGPLLLEAALRYEHNEQSRAPADEFLVIAGEPAIVEAIPVIEERTFDTFSGSAGARFQLSETVSVNAQLFRTERAPVTEELFSGGPHLATQSFDIGNQDLDIEEAVGLEFGLRFAGENASVRANIFRTDYDGFIYQRNTGLGGGAILAFEGEDDPEELEEFGELTVLQFDQADAIFTGFEIEASANLGTTGPISWSGDIVADYVEAKLDEADASGNAQLPQIPPFGVIAGIEADMAQLSLRAEVEHNAEADEVSRFELPTEAFTMTNLYADYQLTERVTLSVAGLNLTDEEARLHTSFLKDQVPLPGRNFRFSVQVSY